MDPAEQVPAVPGAPETGPSPLQAKADAYRFALAATLRSIAAVSNAAASNLETYGQITEAMALIQTLDRLRGQGGDQLECFGAALGSCGSA